MADDKKMKKVSVADIMGGEKSEKSDKSSKPEKSESKPETKKKRKHSHTHIEHHDNGSHTVRHTPMGGGEEVSYAAPDMDAVHDGLEEHVGEPNGDETQGGGEPPESPAQQAPPQGE